MKDVHVLNNHDSYFQTIKKGIKLHAHGTILKCLLFMNRNQVKIYKLVSFQDMNRDDECNPQLGPAPTNISSSAVCLQEQSKGAIIKCKWNYPKCSQTTFMSSRN